MRTLLISLALLTLVGCASSKFKNDCEWLAQNSWEEMNSTQRVDRVICSMSDFYPDATLWMRR